MFGGFGETETATISRLSILANNPSALEAEIIYLCSLPPEFDRTVHRIQEKRGNTHDVLSALWRLVTFLVGDRSYEMACV
ncbi:MAG: hypothetical protein WCG83_06900, partial [Candidatus Peregrinibacteria bacterium]